MIRFFSKFCIWSNLVKCYFYKCLKMHIWYGSSYSSKKRKIMDPRCPLRSPWCAWRGAKMCNEQYTQKNFWGWSSIFFGKMMDWGKGRQGKKEIRRPWALLNNGLQEAELSAGVILIKPAVEGFIEGKDKLQFLKKNYSMIPTGLQGKKRSHKPVGVGIFIWYVNCTLP